MNDTIEEQELPIALSLLQDRIRELFPRVAYKVKLEIGPSAVGKVLIKSPMIKHWNTFGEFRGIGAGIDTCAFAAKLDDVTLRRKVVESFASLNEML